MSTQTVYTPLIVELMSRYFQISFLGFFLVLHPCGRHQLAGRSAASEPAQTRKAKIKSELQFFGLCAELEIRKKLPYVSSHVLNVKRRRQRPRYFLHFGKAWAWTVSSFQSCGGYEPTLTHMQRSRPRFNLNAATTRWGFTANRRNGKRRPMLLIELLATRTK